MKKVKDVVAISGVSKRTLQYYDDIGLMDVTRTPLNYRLYSDEDLDRLWGILMYKEMGFYLNDIKVLLGTDEKKKKRLLDRELDKIRDDIEELERKELFLNKIIENGLPERHLVCKSSNGKTYKELAKILAERF